MPLPALLGMAAGQVLGNGLGMLQGSINDARQLRQNKKLQEQQVEAGKEVARFDQMQAMKMWEETNYAAQREQLEKAGLNVGLLYKGAGQGGSTQGAGKVNMPSSSAAPSGGGELGMGMQMGMQANLMQAQIEQTKATTENIKQDTANKAGGEGTAGVQKEKTQTEIENIAQSTKNAKMQEALMELQQDITQIERNIKAGTEQDAKTAIQSAARSAIVKANIDERTQAQTIKQINRASQEQALRIEAQQKGLIKATADINAVNQSIKSMVNEINMKVQQNQREWDKMSQKEKEILIQEAIKDISKRNSDFNTSTPQQMKQWADLITEVMTMGLSN